MTEAPGWALELVEVNRRHQPPCKVTIAHLHPGDVSASFQRSIQQATIADLGGYRRLFNADGGYGMISTQSGAGRLGQGRNQACEAFLTDPSHAESDLLVFVDSDMGFDPDAVEQLARVTESDPNRYPIVGGLCFGHKPIAMGPQAAMECEWFPTIYRWAGQPGNGMAPGFDSAYEYPDGELVETWGTGAAFVGIRRHCLEAIKAVEGPLWFETWTVPYTDPEGTVRQHPFGEDLSFCLRAHHHGFPVHVHTGVRTSHHKQVWYTEDDYWDDRRPAASAVTVVIPVKDRLDLTRQLVGRLHEQGGSTDVLIVDNGSEDPEMVEWLANQHAAHVVPLPDAGIHHMWNAGMEWAKDRHGGISDLVFLNNDIKVGQRFLRRLVGGMREHPGMMLASANYDGRYGPRIEPVHGICAGRYDGSGGLAGFAFAMRAEFAAGYRFPEDMAWYFGDNDVCLTVERAGGWYGIVRSARVEHVGGGGQTTGGLIGPTYEKDQEVFVAKWQATADAGPSPEVAA